MTIKGCEKVMEVISKGDINKKEETNEKANVKKVIAVMSGKGGVGKSTVTSLLAVSLMQQGFKVGIMDADLTGPSIPKLFGKNNESAIGDGGGIDPVKSDMGIKLMSINFLLEDKEAPVIWRGPAVSGTVKQFFSEVNWGELDYLLVDLPPGTGDVPLTMMQSIPLDGIVIVTSPQDLVNHIVIKSVNMAQKLNVPVLGLVENMSYFECKNCGTRTYIFGESKSREVAEKTKIKFITEIPIDPGMVDLANEGRIEYYLRTHEKFAESFENDILKYL
jgi:Mrp family chromosome partitioning ATPase